MDQLLTAHEVAAALRISRVTFWRLRSAGKLPQPVRVGGRLRWRAVDVTNWIAADCPTGPALQQILGKKPTWKKK